MRKGEDKLSYVCESVGEGGCKRVMVRAIGAGRAWVEIQEKR
jgi:hypothetical protein